MATAGGATMKTAETIPPFINNKKWKKRPWSDAEFLRRLRQDRENRNFDNRMQHFFRAPLNLKADLPLPDYPKTKFSYDLYHVEQLQDICNKATVIYGTDSNTSGVHLYEYISDIWSRGDIHTTDIEFGRLFAKFIRTSRSDCETPTTQDVLKLHTNLVDAADTARSKGFIKESPAEKIFPGIGDVRFKGNQQIEYFNIKPLCRALIIIIESPTKQLRSHFEQECVRLVRTGWATGLSRPIDFEGLPVQKVINENEVVVLLPDAVRFIIDLDEKEESLQEKRDPKVLETWLGDPETQIARVEKAANASEPVWTAGFWPTGPSTEWWEFSKTLE